MTRDLMIALEHRIPPPLLAVVIGGLMWVGAQSTARVLVADSPRIASAVLLMTGGLAFLLSGVLAFRRASTTINPVNIAAASSLVTAGVFRISRNPMYVGFAALLTAWACYLAAPATLAGVVIFILFIQRFQIVPEERVMLEKFGTAFESYKSDIRRWL